MMEKKLPSDLQKALSSNPKAKAAWNCLTPIARRDFSTWIESAKQPETRKRRIEKACDMIVKGKRRPCCYSIMPMDLYRALGADAKAKAAWKELSADEKRDFVDRIEKGADDRKKNIEKECKRLVTGRR